MGGSAGEFGLRSACHSESLSMLVVRSYPMGHVVVHLGRGLCLVLCVREVSARVLPALVQLL